jgi:hypothetical protein
MHGASETALSFVSLVATEANLGGADRDRTGGLLVANQALSQLSYSPLIAVSDQPSAIRKTALPDG